MRLQLWPPTRLPRCLSLSSSSALSNFFFLSFTPLQSTAHCFSSSLDNLLASDFPFGSLPHSLHVKRDTCYECCKCLKMFCTPQPNQSCNFMFVSQSNLPCLLTAIAGPARPKNGDCFRKKSCALAIFDASQTSPYSLNSTLHLTRTHKTLVKSSVPHREYGATWVAEQAQSLFGTDSLNNRGRFSTLSPCWQAYSTYSMSGDVTLHA